jgi:hypothetical protein
LGTMSENARATAYIRIERSSLWEERPWQAL